jgi:mannose-6-phosphate isomerase
MPKLYPLQFRPVFRDYLWGGRRLASVLGKDVGGLDICAESWEIVDHGDDQSVVAAGPLAGTTLNRLTTEYGHELLGRHHPQSRFPLLFKFLDAKQTLSVQVHPDDRQAAQLDPPDLGKTEAWVVLDVEPGSLIYAGLKRGFDRPALEREIARGTSELCLHQFEPGVGDCVFLQAGTVHALGSGLLVAEIQQASDTTYRLFDWNRLGADGKPRQLHIEQGLAAIDYERGPVAPQRPLATDNPCVERLVECDKFVLDRWHISEATTVGGEQRFHILACLEGMAAINIAGHPVSLKKGETVLLPAEVGRVELEPTGSATLLDAYLP